MHQQRYHQALALSGIFQAADLVNTLSLTQQIPKEPTLTMLRSLFCFNPTHALDVYGDLTQLELGIQRLNELLAQQYRTENRDTFHYGFSIIHLERKLSHQPKMLAHIRERLSHVECQREHYPLDHDNVVAHLADIYQKTLSSFKFRIRVKDPKHYLKQHPKHADMVRALLLSGIRSAILWRQLGGNRWQFIFGRKRLSLAAQHVKRDFDEHTVPSAPPPV